MSPSTNWKRNTFGRIERYTPKSDTLHPSVRRKISNICYTIIYCAFMCYYVIICCVILWCMIQNTLCMMINGIYNNKQCEELDGMYKRDGGAEP